jgi:hypothetical protein
MSKPVATNQQFSEASRMTDPPNSEQTDSQPAETFAGGAKYVLWVDRVGSFLVCSGERISLGGPALDKAAADITLLANLSRRHATIVRSREGYLLQAHCPAMVTGRPVHEQTNLNDGYEIQLGDSVRLCFRLPTVLSASARLEFVSSHRPARRIDGVVLMDDTCLLGPGRENHIGCPNWPDSILLMRRDDKLWCKSRMEIFIDGRHAPAGGEIAPGSIVTGPDLRFMIEQA